MASKGLSRPLYCWTPKPFDPPWEDILYSRFRRRVFWFEAKEAEIRILFFLETFSGKQTFCNQVSVPWLQVFPPRSSWFSVQSQSSEVFIFFSGYSVMGAHTWLRKDRLKYTDTQTWRRKIFSVWRSPKFVTLTYLWTEKFRVSAFDPDCLEIHRRFCR